MAFKETHTQIMNILPSCSSILHKIYAPEHT